MSIHCVETDQRVRVLAQWCEAPSEYPRESTVHGLFESIARTQPQLAALMFGDQVVSYGELNHKADRIARSLHVRGIRRGDFVGVCMQRSADQIAALLGVLKAGGAYAPLDLDYPDERLRYMVADTSAAVILVDAAAGRDWLPAAARSDGSIEDVLNSGDDLAPALPFAVDVTAEDAAYVIYTSGSTGNPKGVVVPHRAIVRLVRNTNYCQFGPDETFLHVPYFVRRLDTGDLGAAAWWRTVGDHAPRPGCAR